MERSAATGGLVGWLLPAVAVLVALAASPGFVDGFELPKLIVLELGVGIALLGLAAGACFERGAFRAPAGRAALLFLGCNGLASLGAVEPRTALLGTYGHDRGFITLLVQVACFFLAASWIRSEAALARLAGALAVAATANSLYVIAQSAGLDPLGWPAAPEDARAIYGTLGAGNQVAEFLAMTLPLSIWLVRRIGGRRWLLLAGLGLQLVPIGLLGARAAGVVVVLTVLIGGLVSLGLRPGAGWRLGPAAALAPTAAVLTLFVTLLALPPSAGLLEQGFTTLDDQGSSLKARQLLWRSALAMAADRPLLGWGPDTFHLVYPAYRSTDLDAHEAAVSRPRDAHNVLLQVAVDAGLLGVLAYAGLQVTVLRLLLGGAWGSGSAGTGSPDRRGAALALLLAWTGHLMLFIVGQPRVATDWLAWVIGGAALGLLGGEPRQPRRGGARPARLAALALAGGLLVQAGSALGAEVALARSLEQAEAGRELEAGAWLGRAVSLRPFEPEYHRRLGLQLTSRAAEAEDAAGFGEAIGHFEQAAALLGGREPYVWGQLASAVFGWETVSGQSSDAPFQVLRRGIQLDPLNPLLYARGAELALDRNQPELAREYWQAARARTRSTDAFRRLGDLAELMDDLDAAREAYREAALGEWRPRARAGLFRTWGQAALATGAWDEAEQAFRAALARDPADQLSRLKLADAQASTGRSEAVRSEARRALERARADPNAPGGDRRRGRP